MTLLPLRHLMFALAALLASSAMAAAGSGKLLSIITSNDPEAQAMALILANQAQAEGAQVSVLLCGPAGDAALKAAPESVTKVVTPKGMSVQMLLGGLIKKGGTADVCAIYLPNRKLAKDALMDGVGVATPAAITAKMTDETVKVVGN